MFYLANSQLNTLLSDELDNFKRACALNLHKMWQNINLQLQACWRWVDVDTTLR